MNNFNANEMTDLLSSSMKQVFSIEESLKDAISILNKVTDDIYRCDTTIGKEYEKKNNLHQSKLG